MSDLQFGGQSASDDHSQPKWHWNLAALVRAALGVSAGAAVGYANRDPVMGVTVAAATVTVLRDIIADPRE